MSSPNWYSELAASLKNYFNNPNEPNVDGEQFLRNYLVENPLDSYSEEDEDLLIEEHLDPFQDYLQQFNWVKVNKESYKWINATVAKKSTVAKEKARTSVCDEERLQKIYETREHLKVEEIEWARQELLIDNCDYANIEGLSYKLAKEINSHSRFTLEDKYNAWIFSAKKSTTNSKFVECMEFAADCKASLFKFDDAGKALEAAIYKLDPELSLPEDEVGFEKFSQLFKRRLKLTFRKKQKDNQIQLLRLIRKCRVYYEQAGNRTKSSLLFVIESDVVTGTKSVLSKFLMLFYWLFSKYGESPVRVFATSIIIILIFGLFYLNLGIAYNLSGDEGEEYCLLTNVYFSIVTFTTLGYGDFSPPPEYRLLASVQALIGLFMTSLFLVTFVRRYSR